MRLHVKIGTQPGTYVQLLKPRRRPREGEVIQIRRLEPGERPFSVRVDEEREIGTPARPDLLYLVSME